MGTSLERSRGEVYPNAPGTLAIYLRIIRKGHCHWRFMCVGLNWRFEI